MSDSFFNGIAFKKFSDFFKNLGSNDKLAGRAAHLLYESGFFDELSTEDTNELMGVTTLPGSLSSPVLAPSGEWGVSGVRKISSFGTLRAHIRQEWLTIPSGVHANVKRLLVSPAHNNQVTRVICEWPSVIPQPDRADLLKWSMDHFPEFRSMDTDTIVSVVNASSAPDKELDLIPGLTEFELYFFNDQDSQEIERIDSKSLQNLFLSTGARQFHKPLPRP